MSLKSDLNHNLVFRSTMLENGEKESKKHKTKCQSHISKWRICLTIYIFDKKMNINFYSLVFEFSILEINKHLF